MNKELRDLLAELKDGSFTIHAGEASPPEWWEHGGATISRGLEFQPIEWAELAACRGMDTNFFYPPRSHSVAAGEKIRGVCGECVVSAECLEYALEMEDFHGYYGGCSVDQRKVLAGRVTPGSRRIHFRNVPEIVKVAFNLGEWGPNDEV